MAAPDFFASTALTRLHTMDAILLKPRAYYIDVFVIVWEKGPDDTTDKRWWQRIQQVLEPFGRDVTVLVYSVAGLKAVSNWYVLRLAAEGVLIHG